jgi:hypothetical protein
MAKKDLPLFFVDFDACVAEGTHVRMSKEVHAKSQKDAVQVAHKETAAEYGRTQWCMEFKPLSVRQL